MNKIVLSFIIIIVLAGMSIGLYFIINNSMSDKEKQIYYDKNKNIDTEINYNERLYFYLGELSKIDKIVLNKDELKNINNIDYKKTSYDKAFKKLLIKYRYKDKYFFYNFGDIHKEINNYSFTKNRFNSYKGVILKCFNKDRHWYNVYKKYKIINFDNKINKIFWRGTTTGFENRPGNRYDFIKSWFNKYEHINIGFSSIHQGKNKYKKYVKKSVNIEEMMSYKYLVSIEGNDKDSGLNWKLNSKSLIMMTRPRANSWLMEDKLIPDYHYILLKDDFSDLQEKYKWCENNQDKCKEIIKNAKNYMTQFFNIKREEKLEKDILEIYFSKVVAK